MAERRAAMESVEMTENTEHRFWQDRSVLVTGASGLLGGWLVKSLLTLGSDVVCLVRDWVPRSELVRAQLIERTNVVRGDVCDRGLMERLLVEYEVNTVFHLAAQSIVPIANRNPVSTFETNIGGTWTVLEACRRSPTIRQIILASSDKAYGDHNAVPYSEDMALKARHPYDVSKSCADLIAQTYSATFGLPVAITRCGNFYGGGDLNWNRIVPGTIRSVLNGQPPVIRSDGEYVRDYFYVEDAAAAYIRLAERLAAERSLSGEAFNFSYERPMTVRGIVNLVLQLMGRNFEPVILREATNEIPHQYLSAEKARKELGWKPLFTLETGLERTIDYYRTLLDGGIDL